MRVPLPGRRYGRRLNEVRSWRPEQWTAEEDDWVRNHAVSMKSGLGDRNNAK